MDKRLKLLSISILISTFMILQIPGEAATSLAQSSLTAKALEKVEPLVLEELETNQQTAFFIWLSEKADLSPAYELDTKLEKGWFVYETLVATAERTQAELRSYLDERGVDYQAFYIANKILVHAGDIDLLTSLALRADVAEITANHKFQLEKPIPPSEVLLAPHAIEPNLTFIHADAAWAMGINGMGTVLAGNDTGMDETHPAIARHYRGCLNPPTCSEWDHNYNWWDATGEFPTDPTDGNVGHGTHVTGIMIGDDGGGNQIGVAPGAQTIHCKNTDSGGSGDDGTFTECFQWDLAPWDLNGENPNPALAPDAVNNSWGYWGSNDPIFKDEIQALHAAGILVEVSAGYDGSGCMTLRSPADYWEVLTTGTVNQTAPFPGILSPFSSRGPSELDGNYFPDILAPGDNIRSSVPGGGYEAWSGSSFSGPHATALVGLMWSACPALAGQVYDTIDLIHETAGPLSGQGGACGGDYIDGPNNDWGYGTIDALAAVEAALAQCPGVGYLDGTVQDVDTLLPIEGAQINAEWEGGNIWLEDTDASGYYTLTVPNGTYTLTASAFGYELETLTNVVVETDTVTTQDFTLVPLDLLPDPRIEAMIEQVDSDTIYSYTAGLSGVEPVWVDGEWYTIPSRYTYSGIPIQKATHWTGEHFANLGLDVEYHVWGGQTYPNVIGELPGLINPQDIFIIGGHLDDVSGTPGADDNASGSVAAMIAADIATQFEWGCTLRFALWTGEEQWMLGSYAYAQRSYQQGENILGYLNLDMISWNTPNSPPDIKLFYEPSMQPTLELAQLFEDVVHTYDLNLIPHIVPDQGQGSDQQPFWDYDYTAILAIEDYPNDFNPYYHQYGDNVDHQDMDYYIAYVKAAVGTFAHMSNCLISPEYNVDLSGDDAQTGIPGETLTYTLAVTNSGSIEDTFDVSLGISAFTTTVDTDTVGPLLPDESAEFHVLVSIPESALPGEMDAVVVTVTSQGDSSKLDSATLSSSVGGSYGVQLGSEQTEDEGAAGSTLTYTVSLTNSGSLADTLVLTTTGINPGWQVLLAEDSFDLAGGESVETTFQVTIPGSAHQGDWDAFMLQARSGHDPSKWNEIQFRTTVSEECTALSGLSFTWSPLQPWAGDEMTFVASALGSGPIGFLWDFGDEGTATGEQVLHLYEAGGTYTVTLTASNVCSEASLSQGVTVTPLLRLYLPVVTNVP